MMSIENNNKGLERDEFKMCNGNDLTKKEAHEELMDLTKLPQDVLLEIFFQLHVKDVRQLLFVSKSYHRMASLNYFWWNKCMEEWFEPGSRPTKMTKKESKLDWKLKYFRLTKPEPTTLKSKEKKVKKKIVWEVRVPTKLEMREYYKSIRSKNKGKRLKGQKPTHYVDDFEYI